MTTGLSDIEDLDRESEAAPLIARKLRAPSLGRIWAAVRGDVAGQAERWLLWSPVALGAGCGLYLALPREPGWIEAAGPAAFLLAVVVLVRRWGGSRVLGILATLLFLTAAGVLAGKARTESVATPKVPVLGAVPVTARVVDVASPGATGGRLILEPLRIGDLALEQLPARIRVTAHQDLYGPGTIVHFMGLLNPPPPPASPGAYDFARNAYFDRIGGVGVALSDLQVMDGDPPRALWLRVQIDINAWRWRLAQDIAAQMSPGSAGLGAAMITGHEAWVTQDTENALRDSGLAHIISISGVHMAIVGGFAFMAMRLLIAAWPWLALRVHGKKVAAGAALFVVLLYLIVSGSPPPAERAAITAAVGFGAVLADRRAISLHTLAMAALLILLFQPEAVAEPGFQMSFAATTALVSLAEMWRKPASEINTPWPIRLVQGAGVWLGLSMAASFVAGAATGPFAIQDFNRMAVYGLPANLIEEPLSAFIIMPFLALGAVLTPFGMGGPFLKVAGFGIDLMNGMAQWLSHLPGATVLIASAPNFTLPMAFFGLLWLCLWKGWLRWLGAPLAFAVLLWPRPEAPVAWISPDGTAAAIRHDKQAILIRPDAKLFDAQLWAHRRGLTPPDDAKGARDVYFDCDHQSCRAAYGGPIRISDWWTKRTPKPERLEALCQSSDILVIKAFVDLPEACNRVRVLRPDDFARGGAAEIYRDGRIVWTQPGRGERPWSAVASEAP